MSGPAAVLLERLSKRFGSTVALADVDLVVEPGEFLTLLGPSGCGKTTTLRLVAGFLRPSAGRVLIGGRVVADAAADILVEPERRNIGMVFQSYALWPHMTVFENVAFALESRGVRGEAVRRRVGEVLELVRLGELAERFPQELSGGQQQRVALARALVHPPDVLLLDEPLSNLDARLREELRLEMQALQRRLELTVLFVTHDQAEAMALSDRIAVMRGGKIEQIGPPEELYDRPTTPFVADFLGGANLLPSTVSDGWLTLGGQRVGPASERVGAERSTLLVHPEDVRLDATQGALAGVVEAALFLGDRTLYDVRVGEWRLRVIRPGRPSWQPGDPVRADIERWHALSPTAQRTA